MCRTNTKKGYGHGQRSLVDFPDSSAGKKSACNKGHPSLIPGSGSPPGEGIDYQFYNSWASLMAQMSHFWVGKIPWRRAWQSTPVFLPGEYPWTEEPHRLQSMRSQRVRHDWAIKHTHGDLHRNTRVCTHIHTHKFNSWINEVIPFFVLDWMILYCKGLPRWC